MNLFGIILNPADLWLLKIAGALAGILAISIVGRASIRFVAKRKTHSDNISKCIAPFSDALANIHLGEHNHIRIMRSFFREQKEAVAIFKSQCAGKNLTGLQTAWEAYKKHYEDNANGTIYTQFASIPEPFKTEELDLLHAFLSNIITKIKKT